MSFKFVYPKRISLFILAAIVALFSISVIVQAHETEVGHEHPNNVDDTTLDPVDLSKDINIDRNSDFEPGGNLAGRIYVKNNSNFTSHDLNLIFVLFNLPEDFNKSQFSQADLTPFLIDSDPRSFSLRGGEEMDLDFELSMPSNLPPGEYILEVWFVRENQKKITVESENLGMVSDPSADAIFVEDTNMVIDGEEIPSIAGPAASPSQDIFCRLYLNDTGQRSFVPKVKVYGRFIGGNLFYEDFAENVEIADGNFVDIPLPKMEKPQSYVATIQLFDQEDQEVSSIAACRWIISGQGATILDLRTEDNRAEAGLPLNINFRVLGPADIVAFGDDHSISTLENALIKIQITDLNTGEVIGETERDVSIVGQRNLSFPVEIIKDSNFFQVEVQVIEDGQVLDAQTFVGQPSLNEASNKIFLILGGLLVLILLSALILYLSNKEEDNEELAL